LQEKTWVLLKPPTIMFKSDQGNAQKLLGKTAHYDPTTNHVVVYVTGRHPKDVLRSLSHELVHHAQNCRGEFGNTPDTAPGYAQKDNHMRKMEEEAYKVGNLCFRDWEDGVKSGKIKVSVTIKEGLLKENKENYTIVSGDTLSGIAGKFYGDVHMWPSNIYQ
jgi:LysM repeat protein